MLSRTALEERVGGDDESTRALPCLALALPCLAFGYSTVLDETITFPTIPHASRVGDATIDATGSADPIPPPIIQFVSSPGVPHSDLALHESLSVAEPEERCDVARLQPPRLSL